jgi:hypothetical protein
MAVRKERSSCALFGNIAQHDELFFTEFDELVDALLAVSDAREQPLGGDHTAYS